jgi:3',5'-cyclic AMP phosphodiesterase CpdA
MLPLPPILRQALAPALRRLWPPAPARALPRPFQANPLAPQTRRAMHAAQSFVVLGDPGDRGPAQYHLAQQLIQEFQQRPFGCLVMLGDNVYEYGEPAHFDAALGQPYRFFREQHIPVYAVLGNHDVQTAHGVLQLQYWGGLPRYYQFTIAQGAVVILALDTTLLLPGTYDCYATPAAHAWAQRLASHQLTWLARALRTRGAPLKIVIGHYPLYSSGLHGLETAIQAHLRQRLEPLLTDAAHGVQVYLAGHEHLFELTPPIRHGYPCSLDQGGVIHMVSGAAARLSQVDIPHPPYPRWTALAQHHYVRFDWAARDNVLHYTVKDGHSSVLGYGIIPARASQYGASWSISDHGSGSCGDLAREVQRTGTP